MKDIIFTVLGLSGAIGIPVLCIRLTDKMREAGRQSCERWVTAHSGAILHMDVDFNAFRELKGVVKWKDISGEAHTMRYTGKSVWNRERFEDQVNKITQNQAAQSTARKLADPGR